MLFDEIVAIQDRVTSGENDPTRVMVNAYVGNELDAVTADAVDTGDVAGVVPKHTPLQSGSARQASPIASTAEPVGEQVDASVTTGDHSGRYDRARLAQGTAQAGTPVDTEAVLSRTTSAPGFSRPTREMLGDDQHGHGPPAKRAAAESPTRTVGRGQHR